MASLIFPLKLVSAKDLNRVFLPPKPVNSCTIEYSSPYFSLFTSVCKKITWLNIKAGLGIAYILFVHRGIPNQLAGIIGIADSPYILYLNIIYDLNFSFTYLIIVIARHCLKNEKFEVTLWFVVKTLCIGTILAKTSLFLMIIPYAYYINLNGVKESIQAWHVEASMCRLNPTGAGQGGGGSSQASSSAQVSAPAQPDQPDQAEQDGEGSIICEMSYAQAAGRLRRERPSITKP